MSAPLESPHSRLVAFLFSAIAFPIAMTPVRSLARRDTGSAARAGANGFFARPDRQQLRRTVFRTLWAMVVSGSGCGLFTEPGGLHGPWALYLDFIGSLAFLPLAWLTLFPPRDSRQSWLCGIGACLFKLFVLSMPGHMPILAGP